MHARPPTWRRDADRTRSLPTLPASIGAVARCAVRRDRRGRASRARLDRLDPSGPRRSRTIAKARREPADKPGSVVGSHSSGSCVAAGLKQPTRGRRGPRHGPPIRSCSGWGLPCRSVAGLAVRSYRTVSPLPDPLARPSAVCSLLHFPSARAAQALPGTLPCGARTFLDACAPRLPSRLPLAKCTSRTTAPGRDRCARIRRGAPAAMPAPPPRPRR